jgi:HAD superfamily hydrolase (TIGR01549 family)
MDLERTRALLEETRRELGTLTRTLESLGIDRNKFFNTMTTRIEPSEYLNEDVTVNKVLATLKEQGFKIALVSNSGRSLVDKILRALRLNPSNFDTIITSSDAKPKPSHDPFLLAMKLMKCSRGAAVYVGDRDEAELRPAKELGILTVLLDRTGNSSAHWADAVVRNLSDIPHVVNGMLAK